ncbi:GNAT family N-acetyltransferase [Paenisporosarcina indica]|uniref:GNAT family N-acetyltransferase n=1 Tax=Paenisporosarcina indica TaxID=650093 RepID=UPI000A8A3EC7|nr:GNAT family N-acetyltransferase [Paenisporosarcina indica]
MTVRKDGAVVNEITAKNSNLSIRKLLSHATSEDKVDQEYEKYIQLLNRKLYEFEFSGQVVGCIGIELSTNSIECEIKHIAVCQNHRGKGIGSKMINSIIDKHKMSSIYAETDSDAVNFYRNFGFEISSLGERYPGVERFLCVYKSK